MAGYLTTNTLQGAAIGAVAGGLSGTRLGGTVLAGAVLGGITNASFQLASGRSLSSLQLTPIFGSALAGALGAASGLAAASYFQLPYNAIGRAQGEFFGDLSNSVISSAVGGVAGSGADAAIGGACPAN